MNCLFIGNGLTKTIDRSSNWSKLLEDVANENGSSLIDGIPMTLQFEHIVNQKMKLNPSLGDKAYLEIKGAIASKLNTIRLKPDAVHYKLKELPADHIITTNYDYLIEESYGITDQYKSNQKYIYNYTQRDGSRYFYHAHGVINAPKTICLGYEHYAGFVQHIRERINTRSKDSGKNSDMKIVEILNGSAKAKLEWPELFYNSNISFIGYGLDDCEMDIWWLLTHRAYLYYSNIDGAKKYINNKIIFYDILEDIPNSDENRIRAEQYKEKKHQLLKSLHVEVVPVSLQDHSGDFEAAYGTIFQKIKEDWK